MGHWWGGGGKVGYRYDCHENQQILITLGGLLPEIINLLFKFVDAGVDLGAVLEENGTKGFVVDDFGSLIMISWAKLCRIVGQKQACLELWGPANARVSFVQWRMGTASRQQQKATRMQIEGWNAANREEREIKTHSCHGGKQPNDKNSLDEVVEGNPVEHNIGKELNDVEKGKDTPVGQPGEQCAHKANNVRRRGW